MKRIWIAALSFCLILAGCASVPAQSGTNLRMVCTVFPCYDLARAVLGDGADVTMLIAPGAEAHSYDPTPSDILKIRRCDVFVMIGGESEAWADTILSSLDTSVRVVRLMDSVDALEEEYSAGMEAEETGEEDPDAAAEWDEHIWTSPRNMMTMVDAVASAACEAAPDSAGMFQANAAAYRTRLQVLDEEFAEAVAQGRRKKIVFGDRFPFLYFVREFGLEWDAAFPGCSSASEPGVATVAALVNTIRSEGIPVVFKLEMSNGRLADTLAQETGARVLTFHSCHNVSAREFEAGETYVSLMQGNLENLRAALE